MSDANEFPEPCQPIGCDNGYHLSGCFFAAVDEPEPDQRLDDVEEASALAEAIATCGTEETR